MQPHNIHLEAADGKVLELGKVCRIADSWAYHYWAGTSERRRDSESWGLRKAILDYLADHGIEDIYVYDKHRDCTYITDRHSALEYGIRGKTDAFGETVNLPAEYWTVIRGRVQAPFVPSGLYRRVKAAGAQLGLPIEEAS